jgi:predicted CopG family antitoxin
MKMTKTIELSDDVYERIERLAQEKGITPTQVFLELAQMEIDFAHIRREEEAAYATPERRRALWIKIYGDDKLFDIDDKERIQGIMNPPKLLQKPIKWLD